MERWHGRVALVTGASAGIGAAIAYQLQDAGMRVVAVARRANKISAAVEKARQDAARRGRPSRGKSSSPGELHPFKCDVTKEQDVIDAFKWAKHHVGGVDVLVNSAGVAGEQKLYDTSTEEIKKILDINVFGLTICTREAIQQMRSRGIGDGHIVNISSTCGHTMPSDFPCAMYHASKHAVRVLTEGLRKELVTAKSRIRVTQICPGFVKTDILNGMPKISGEDLFQNNPHLSCEDVADATLYALSVPAHVQIHDIILRAVGELE